MNLDVSFSALGDPTRRAILAHLAHGTSTATDIAVPLGLTRRTISRHLRILESSGLILRYIEGAKRPFRLNPRVFFEIEKWFDVLHKTAAKNVGSIEHVWSDPKASNHQIWR
jgi:DNA-binding transcriptional ArsR family regulator